MTDLVAVPLAANAAAIGQAIHTIRPRGALQLVAIDPQKRSEPIGRSFVMPDDVDDATQWAVEENDRGWGVYFAPNLAPADLHRKADKSHMAMASFVWSDCDPWIFKFGSYERARSHLLGPHLDDLKQSASLVIDSGNGLQAFWRLEPGVSLVGGYHEYENVNKAIGEAFDGPSTFDCCRVMRLPGTINYPTETKIKKGYPIEPRVARLVSISDKAYTIEQLQRLAEWKKLDSRLSDFLAGAPKARHRWEGGKADLVDNSGSAMDMSMFAMLKAGGFAKQEIRAILEKWPHGSDLGREQNDRYWDRMWDRSTVPEREVIAPLILPVESMLLTPTQLENRSGEVSWLVKNYIQLDGLGIVFGDTGTFKSFVILDLCCSIAHGLPWLGQRTVTGNAIYVAGEGGGGMARRVKAWHQHRGLPYANNLRIVIEPLILDEVAYCRRLSDEIESAGLGDNLVVSLDTMSQVSSADENSAQEVQRFFRLIGLWLRARYGCSVVVLHHSGHSETGRARGSSSLRNNIDFMFRIERVEGTRQCVMHPVKQKDDDLPPPVAFDMARIVIGRDQDGDEVSSMVANHIDQAASIVTASHKAYDEYAQAVIESLSTGNKRPPQIRDEVMRAFPGRSLKTVENRVYAVLKELKQSGVIDGFQNIYRLIPTFGVSPN